MKTESCVIKIKVYDNNKKDYLIAEVEADLFTEEGIKLLDTFLKTYEDYVGRENTDTYDTVWEIEVSSSIPILEERIDFEISETDYWYDYCCMLHHGFDNFTKYGYDEIAVGAFIFFLNSFSDCTIDDLLFSVSAELYDYIKKADYETMGKDIAENEDLLEELDNRNVLNFFDFEAYAKFMLDYYTYVEGYGYYTAHKST